MRLAKFYSRKINKKFLNLFGFTIFWWTNSFATEWAKMCGRLTTEWAIDNKYYKENRTAGDLPECRECKVYFVFESLFRTEKSFSIPMFST